MTRNRRRGFLLVLLSGLLLLLVRVDVVESVLKTGGIDVRVGESGSDENSYTFLVSQGLFGSFPEMSAANNEARALTVPPDENPLLCDNITTTDARTSWTGSIILVPRGVCTFEQKAYSAEQMGAEGVLVHGSLGSRYSLNTTKRGRNPTTADIIYPQEFYDYDCKKGRAWIPSTDIELQPLPYNAKHNDPILSNYMNDESYKNNLCKLNSADSLQNCPSQACFLTGNISAEDEAKMEACCAWDLSIWMYADTNFQHDVITIPSAFVTMEQGNQLLKDLRDHKQVYVTMYSRYRPNINTSFFLIWVLGVTVCALAAYMSANEYRAMIRFILQKQHERLSGNNTMQRQDLRTLNGVGHQEQHELQVRPRSCSPNRQVNNTTSASEGGLDQQQVQQVQETEMMLEIRQSSTFAASRKTSEESLELDANHAFGFIILASSGLLFLFYFKIYSTVKVLYGIGCSKAISQVIFGPICMQIANKVGYRNVVIWNIQVEDIGDITFLDIVSHMIGYSVGIAWIVLCFTQRHPEQFIFFWVVQDMMGASMCITFLETIKLNSIRVASILLLVAFFYDIFFVFITPLLFKGGESVMVTVATSGGPPKADELWCEKYPDDTNCQGGDPLPMLLTMPRIGDYQGGSSLLGLGDIVLPGLLLSFAARYDTAKSLLGVLNGGNGLITSFGCPEEKFFCGNYCNLCSGGYFIPLVIAYAVGLLMANAAVLIMQMGQPALLYLVPSCLGTMIFMGWRRKELKELWDGPRVIRTADEMLHGSSTSTTSTDEVTSSSDDNHAASNSTQRSLKVVSTSEDKNGDDTESGDVPLLSNL